MSEISPKLNEHLNGLTNEISRRHFDEALEHGREAIASDELHSDENRSILAAVYRNMGAANDHLGRDDIACDYMEQAYRIHDDQVAENRTPEALRERSATASYIGIFATKAYLAGQRQDSELAKKAIDAVHQAAADMAEASRISGDKYHQYEINMTGRWSMIESLVGSKGRGFVLAGRAIRLAPLSEKNQQKGLTKKDVLRARKRALMRGVAAMAVNLASCTKPTEKVAESIANKAM